MVVGIPNCGKSTLINSLVAKKRAKTGNRPGVTRAPQWVSIDEYVDLLDTPGTLYPDFSDAKKAVKLAAVGSIKDTVIDNTELALEILGFLKTNTPTLCAPDIPLPKYPTADSNFSKPWQDAKAVFCAAETSIRKGRRRR
jgi:ribosome biogenesis GTPase A